MQFLRLNTSRLSLVVCLLTAFITAYLLIQAATDMDDLPGSENDSLAILVYSPH